MKIQSAKKKGRALCVKIKELILKAVPDLDPQDIAIPPPSCPGEDLWLSPKARRALPISIEAKNQETAKVWDWIAQAKSNASTHVPVVVFSRNREPEPYVIVSLRDFLFLMADQSAMAKGGSKNE